MGRPATGYTEHLTVSLRPTTARALEGLAKASGLSKRHLVRVAVEAFLTDAGVLLPVDLPVTTFNSARGGNE